VNGTYSSLRGSEGRIWHNNCRLSRDYVDFCVCAFVCGINRLEPLGGAVTAFYRKSFLYTALLTLLTLLESKPCKGNGGGKTVSTGRLYREF